MTERDILVPAAVLSVLRRDDSVRGVADRLGVTEAQVREWVDVFVVAGVLALQEHRTSGGRHGVGNERTTRHYSTAPTRFHRKDSDE